MSHIKEKKNKTKQNQKKTKPKKNKKRLLEMVLNHYEHNVVQHPNFKICQVFLNCYNG